MGISIARQRGNRHLGSLLGSLLVGLALIASSAGPARAEDAATYMKRVASDLVAASLSGSAAVAAAMRSHADVPSIGLSALGSYAATLPKSDRPSYFNGMINFVARYVATTAPKYPVARAIITGQSRETAGGAYVDSQVVLRSGETYDVRWLLVRRGDGYKVRDAEVLGFSAAGQLGTLFQNYIGENGGNPKILVMALNR